MLKEKLFGLNVVSFIFSVYSSATLIFLAWLRHPWWLTGREEQIDHMF